MKISHKNQAAPAATFAAALLMGLFAAGCVTEAGNDESSASALAKSGNQASVTASVKLGKAGDFVILAKSGISTTGNTKITGNIGVSPAAATYITGFSLVSPPSSYSTSALVTGKVYAADYASPTPANLTRSVLDMQTAYADAAGRAPSRIELGAGNIGGLNLAPGVYKWTTNVLASSDVTLTGSSTAVWIFEIAGNLTLGSGVKVVLKGGALPKNVFWQVAGAADLGTTAHIEGIVLCKTAIVLKTGATANGRLLAQTAVTLDASTVVKPAP